MEGKTIEQIHIGDVFEEKRLVDEIVVSQYADLTGDFNPIHRDEAYASKTIFKHRIVHGMLIGGYISRILGTILPGEGCIYLKQEICFLKPIYIGDTISIKVEVIEKMIPKNRIVLAMRCFDSESKMCVDGKAIVMPRK